MGEHTVIFAGPGERLELTHRAASRETFAVGRVARRALGASTSRPGSTAWKMSLVSRERAMSAPPRGGIARQFSGPGSQRMRAGIALGANLGDRLLCLTTARDRIFTLPEASRAVSFLGALRNRAGRMRTGRGEVPQRGGRDRLYRYFPATAGGAEENRIRSRAAAGASPAIARARSISTCFIMARACSMSRTFNCPIRVCHCAASFSIHWRRSGPISSCPGRPKTVREMTEELSHSRLRWCVPRGSGSVACHGGFSRA